jgi:pyrroline-5-carboxylate reductase
MSTELTIGFLGAGKMALALAKGFTQANLVTPQNLRAADPVDAARAAFAKELGCETASGNRELVNASRVVILAVKPDQVGDVLEEIAEVFTENHLLISIAAGVTLGRLESSLAENARVIRVMPNTPALIGASASAYALGAAAQLQDAELAQELFSSIGLAFRVREKLLDAVTGLSGSGPAYVFAIIDALSDGGVAAGLPRDIATQLAAQTLLGAARLVLETGKHPGELKDMVTSPGGTTIEGLHELEKGGVRGALINAVRAAADKARVLGQRYGQG